MLFKLTSEAKAQSLPRSKQHFLVLAASKGQQRRHRSLQHAADVCAAGCTARSIRGSNSARRCIRSGGTCSSAAGWRCRAAPGCSFWRRCWGRCFLYRCCRYCLGLCRCSWGAGMCPAEVSQGSCRPLGNFRILVRQQSGRIGRDARRIWQRLQQALRLLSSAAPPLGLCRRKGQTGMAQSQCCCGTQAASARGG